MEAMGGVEGHNLRIDYRSRQAFRTDALVASTAGPIEDAVRVPERRDGHADCLSSADSVWAAHPGSHAAWTLRLRRGSARDSTKLPEPRHLEPARGVTAVAAFAPWVAFASLV